MAETLVDFATLQAITGYQRLADVERCLTEQGIHVFRGKGTVWTTVELINAGGGLRPDGSEMPYSPDIIG